MKRITGLESMDCRQMIQTMDEIIKQSEAEAEALTQDIQISYEERDKADKAARKAAESKDLKAYKEARLHYDMLTEWIGKAEADHDSLLYSPLIPAADSGTIKQRMLEECYNISGRAALQIQELHRQMIFIHEEMKKQIRERNAVLLKLNQITRPMNQDGEPAAPQLYKDTVIAPYLSEVFGLQGTIPTAFKLFAEGYQKPAKQAGTDQAAGSDPEAITGKPITRRWNGERWEPVKREPAGRYTGFIED